MLEPFRPPWREGRGPIPRLVVQPVLRFIRLEAAGGVVIVAAAVVALIWANALTDSYADFWDTDLTLDLGFLTLDETLHGWVNDALMVIFFFVIALEIKREAVHGELRDPRQAALPVIAALGGMLVPILIFSAVNAGGEGAKGWGIPVATDIAFALGVLALVGNRIPVQLKIFLLTLAVADDIGGILIIAVFLSDDLSIAWLLGAGATVVGILVMQRGGIRPIAAYIPVGLVLWLCVFESGVEATIAGVVLGLLTPARSLYQQRDLGTSLHDHLDAYDSAVGEPEASTAQVQAAEALRSMEHLTNEALSPLERLEESVQPWSAFLIIPIFALANAGIVLSGDILTDAFKSELAWGVFLGLVVGKAVGVTGFSVLAVRLGVAKKPAVISWPDVVGVAFLAGVGFTVAIFIAGLSFSDPILVENAKIGIFAASLVAALLGFVGLRISQGRKVAQRRRAAEGATESTS